jgi:hypothetical protein
VEIDVVEINVRNKSIYSGKGEYIGRPSTLGNPFRVSKTQPRSLAINRYGLWLKDCIDHNNPTVINSLQNLFEKLIDQGKLDLICWCAPERCHAEVIKQVLLNRYYHGSWLVDDKIGMITKGLI